MDLENGTHSCCLENLFHAFVFISLSLLLGVNVYSYLWGPSINRIDGDFSDIQYIVAQLTRELNDVNRKEDRLQEELERLSAALPAVSAAATRNREVLVRPSCSDSAQAVDVQEYDRQVVDFALESAGARVLDTGDTLEHALHDSSVGWALHTLVSVMSRSSASAAVALRPGALPGECWAFKGSKGEMTIRLLGTVHISGITLEHIPPQISPTKEITSAPRYFKLEGLRTRADLQPHDYGTFEYRKDGKPIQYFAVQHPTRKGYNIVRVQILSNWGHPVYTCVYRIRVHGELASGQTATLPTASDPEMCIENE